jgi:PAS domain S-box-containing protein
MSTAADVRHDRARFVAFAFARADLLVEIDSRDQIVFASGAASWAVGHASDALVGRPFADLLAPGSSRVRDAIRAAAKNSKRLRSERVMLKRAGSFVNASVAGFPMPDRPGNFVLSIAHEEEDAPAAANAPRRLPSGLRESTNFAAEASAEIKRAGERGEELELTMLDVPDVEKFKEKLGGKGSDAFLTQVGQLLKAGSVGGDSAAELGDGKFSVLHKKAMKGEDFAAGIADLARSHDPTGQGVAVHSVGMNVEQGDMSGADVARAVAYAVTRFAETQDGEFTMTSLNSSIEELVQKTVSDVAKFRGALAGSGFQLTYQPIVDLSSEQPLYQEALTRLADGSSPFQMVTFAEEIGVIAELDQSVVSQVLELLDKEPEVLDVTVNVSARSLQSPAFANALEELLLRYPSARERMLVELTESRRIQNFTFTANVLERIRNLKVRVCLDDFGAGATTFEYLRLLPLDVVKIDGTYVKSIATNTRDRAFVRAIAELSRELGLVTVAEWVEDRATADVLKQLNVGRAQGWFFGKPAVEPLRRTGFVTAEMGAKARQQKIVRGAVTGRDRR